METNFNFKSHPCTSIEQSERLLALGLKKETADMIYVEVHCTDGSVEWSASPIMEGLTALDYEDDWPPAWSLHRLLCMLPQYIRIRRGTIGRMFYVTLDLTITEDLLIGYKENTDTPCYDELFYAENIYESICKAIEWLIKEGYFNKEYLV